MITNSKGHLLGFSSSPKKIKKIATKIIASLQDHPRGDIVVALSVLWLMICARYQLKHHEVLQVAERMYYETQDSSEDPEFKAIKEYMEDEL